MDPRKNERPERHDEGPDKVSETQTDGKVVGGRSRSNSDGTPAAAPAVTSSPHSDPRASPVSMKEGDSSDIPSSSEQDKKMDKTHAPEAASPSAVQQYNNNSTSTGTSNKKVNQHLYHAPARDVEATTIRDHNPNDTGSALGAPATGGEGDTSINSVEKDAAHFKMVAARFRALMERRERRLEEAMSDPQTRTDLEGMFPGVREGDYQTLLAGVRGMEEEDFQALLAAARKRRREEERGERDRREGQQQEPQLPSKMFPVAGRSPALRDQPPPPGAMPPPPLWDRSNGGHQRHFYPPPPHPHPHAYADPYYYARGDPRGGPRDHPTGAGEGPPRSHPGDDDPDGDGVFPHYSASGGRGGGARAWVVGGGGRGGSGVTSGGPGVWSRHHGSHPQWHPSSRLADGEGPVRGRGIPADGKNSAATPSAPGAAEEGSGSHAVRGSDGSRPSGGGGANDSYYHHPYYRGEREPTTDGRGRNGARNLPAHLPYDVDPPRRSNAALTAATSAGDAAAGHHPPYAGPPLHDRDRHGGVGGDVSGGNGSGRSPMKNTRAHAAGPPPDHEPSRHYGGAEPAINRALCEAVDRISHFRKHREVDRVASPETPAGAGATRGAVTDSAGVDKERGGVGGGGSRGREAAGGARPPGPEAKKVAMRLCELMDRCDGRMEEVMADPRARAELEAIFPGLDEKEFRSMLLACVERTQPADQDNHSGERAFRREADVMYPERGRPSPHRREPEHPHHPSARGVAGYLEMESPMYRDPRDRYFSPERHAYQMAAGVYRDPRDAYAPPPSHGGPPNEAAYPHHPVGGRGSAGGVVWGSSGTNGNSFMQPKHEYPEDVDKAYEADPEGAYPDYSMMTSGSAAQRRGPPYLSIPLADGGRRGSPPVPLHSRNGGRHGTTVAAVAEAATTMDAAVAAPSQHPLYNASRQPAGSLTAPTAAPSMHSARAGAVGNDGPQHHLQLLHHRTRGRSNSSTGDSPALSERRGSDPAAPPPPPGIRGSSASSRGAPVARDGTASAGAGGGGSGNDGDVGLHGRHRSRSGSPDDEQAGKVARATRTTLAPSAAHDRGEEPFCEVVRDASGVTRLFIPETPPVVPRRPPSKGNKRETLADIAHRIPVSVMRPYFNYPLRTAAEAMNISVTTLKRLCRRHGVKRWPHRQISGINRAMAHLEFQQDQAGRRADRAGGMRTANQVSDQMQELLRRRRVMIEHAFESDDGGTRPHWRNSFDSDEDVVDTESFFSDTAAKQRNAKGGSAAETDRDHGSGIQNGHGNDSHNGKHAHGNGHPAAREGTISVSDDHFYGNVHPHYAARGSNGPPLPYESGRRSPGHGGGGTGGPAGGGTEPKHPGARGGGLVPPSPESPSDRPEPRSPPRARAVELRTRQPRRRLLPASAPPPRAGEDPSPSSPALQPERQQQPRQPPHQQLETDRSRAMEKEQEHERSWGRNARPMNEEQHRRLPRLVPRPASGQHHERIAEDQQQQQQLRAHGQRKDKDVDVIDRGDGDGEDGMVDMEEERQEQSRRGGSRRSAEKQDIDEGKRSPSFPAQQQEQQQQLKRKQQSSPVEETRAPKRSGMSPRISPPPASEQHPQPSKKEAQHRHKNGSGNRSDLYKQQQQEEKEEGGRQTEEGREQGPSKAVDQEQKPPSPLTCGPRRQRTKATRTVRGSPSPSSSSDGDTPAALPELPGFSLPRGKSPQKPWGAPTAPTASAS